MTKNKQKLLKRYLPKTLLGRSLLILVIPIFLIQIFSTYIFFDRHWSRVTSRLGYAVAGEVALLTDYIVAVDYDDVKVQRVFDLYEQKLGLIATFEKSAKLSHDGQGAKIIPDWEEMIRATLHKELDNAIPYPYTVDVDFYEKWVEVRVEMSQGILNVSLPQRRLFSSTTYIFLLWMFAASLVLLIIAILFMRNQIRPIKRLAIAAEHFGKGRDVKSFKVEGAKEVRQAGTAFLDMKQRIQRQITQRTEMLAGVSHDLRTPITRLKLQIAMLGDSPDIYEMKRDITDMEKMIDGYLNFVRGEGTEPSVMTNIADLLRDVSVSTKRQGCDVDLQLNDLNIKMFLRKMSFKRCLMNILSNATKYADFIWITLEKINDKEIRILIEDNGPGIPEENLKDVFRPFYRVDTSRNMDTGGIGLGLPIAKDIINSHGGDITLKNSERGGLAVSIVLPI